MITEGFLLQPLFYLRSLTTGWIEIFDEKFCPKEEKVPVFLIPNLAS
jgi:hypothetical protein